MDCRKVLAAALLCFMPCLAMAASWWNGDWEYRKEIDFDLSPTGSDVAGSVQNVPILVRLSLGNFNYFNDVNADGSDLRVIDADDRTPLKFHPAGSKPRRSQRSQLPTVL